MRIKFIGVSGDKKNASDATFMIGENLYNTYQGVLPPRSGVINDEDKVTHL